MKNVFFALAFMLVGTLAFANTSESKFINENAAIENVEFSQSEKAIVVDGSVKVTLSCGISGTLTWTGDASTADLINAVSYYSDLLC